MTVRKSANPAYPDADPTAPGGMSQKQLLAELTTKHGWTPDDLIETGFVDDQKGKPVLAMWGALVETVIAERREREHEAKAELPDPEQIGPVEVEVEFCDPDEEDYLDPEAFFAELADIQENPLAHPTNTEFFIGSLTTRDFVFDNHAGAGPSGAERWMNCTESLGMARKFLETLTPNQQEQFARGGSAARQGTTAHAAAEAEALLVLSRIEETERDATLLELTIEPDSDEEYSEEMGDYISEYVDLIRTYATERGDDHVFIEQRVEAVIPLPAPLSNGEDWYVISGSADTAVYPTKVEPDLVVVDLKYGAGIDVDADENAQARLYALGVLALLTDENGDLITDVRTVTLVIAQPRLGGIKVYTETLDDLLDWRDDVLAPALYAALTGDGAVFAPGEKTCQWCPARGSCPALAESRVTAGAELFDTIVEAEFADGPGAFPETALLDSVRLGSLLSQIEGLVNLKDVLREEAQRRLHRGEEVPGYKLVGYTPPKKWEETTDKQALIEAGLPDETIESLFVEKMLTPKQALTVLKNQEASEAAIHDLMTHPVQKPVIARVDDRRHEWKGAPPELMFPDLPDEDEGANSHG